MQMETIKAVLFDMDGLMFDTEALARDGLRIAMKSLGLQVDETSLSELLGRNLPDSLKILTQRYGSSAAEEILRIMNGYLDMEIEIHGAPEKAGLRELLAVLDEKKIPTAVVSGSDRDRISKNLWKSAMEHVFDTIVSGDEVTHGKPDPEPFLLAAEKLGIAPEDCLVLEDSPAGIASGVAAGMKTIMVPDLQAPTERESETCLMVASSLFDIIELL